MTNSRKKQKMTKDAMELKQAMIDLQKAFSDVKLPKNFDVVKFIKKWR